MEKRDAEESLFIRSLIVDDTDFPKTGRKTELLGRVFSHVTRRSILAFKGLFLCYHDGKSLYVLDYSLHGEKGKNQKKLFGVSLSDAKKRYAKKRDKSSEGQKRVKFINRNSSAPIPPSPTINED